jgi:DNA-binding GntR family transcriptional regulator
MSIAPQAEQVDDADRLALSVADLVVVRRRVRYLNDEPFNINDTFYPFDLVQGSELVSPADIARGASLRGSKSRLPTLSSEFMPLVRTR